MIEALVTGLVLGLSAGLAPGPLLALLFSETIRHGLKSGLKVAMAPLITDLPIIIIAILVLNRLESFSTALGVISILGGLVVLALAYENFRAPAIDAAALQEARPKSLAKGVLVNFLSPHPYLFWLTVGGPIVVANWRSNPPAALVFILTFYLLLIGAKILLAFLFQRAGALLTGRSFALVRYCLALLLLIFAGVLFRDGISRILF